MSMLTLKVLTHYEGQRLGVAAGDQIESYVILNECTAG